MYLFADATNVILISGKAGVGKTTTANYIIEYLKSNYPYLNVVKSSFAQGVKDAARDCFGWDGEKDSKGRKLLQDIGRVGREYNKDVWVKQSDNLLRTSVVPFNLVIIDDWRFPNEKDYLSNAHYRVHTVRIVSPDREILRGTDEYYDVSEISLLDTDTYNAVIYNTDTLHNLNLLSTKLIEYIIEDEKRRIKNV